MKEQILEVLKSYKRALTLDELMESLELKTAEELRQLISELAFMEKQSLVYRTNKEKYMLFEDCHLKSGRLSVNRGGFGFVLMNNEPDIRIEASDMNGALHNDLVLVELKKDNEGRIVRILDREKKELVGEYYLKDGMGCIKLDDKKYKMDIEIDTEDNKGAVAGHKVLVKIVKELGKGKYKGQILEILGHKNDPGVDILSIIYAHGINTDFTNEIMAEVEQIPSEVSDEEIVRRRDLRNDRIFTIDGADAKDLDDAVSIKKLSNGNYLLGVHIADVSYYVKENSEIDKEAYDRGTSVYLVDRVIPMLPHTLSNGICSLNEKVNRLTVSCDMEIDNKGNIVKNDIYESVINSNKRMTYKAVNEILEQNQIPVGYEPFVEDLKMMSELANILREAKERRGFIDFDADELKVVVDEEGKPTDVVLRERGTGEKLIEDFMIAANETVASHIFWMELPFVYRIHEYPKEEKIESFISFVSYLGYKIKGKNKDYHPKTVQNIINSLKDKKEFPILSSMLLRSMQKAVYKEQNLGHYGLASQCYTHFTSPIRRYPDTTVHRLLRTYLFNNMTDSHNREYWAKKLVPLCEHSSLKEQEAVECERDVDDLKTAEYMEQHVGDEYEGMISSVMNFGMFVQLDNLIEGLVHISDIKGDYYTFSEKSMSLIGKNSKKKYRIGDRVKVKVIAASKEQRTIDFVLVEKNK